MNTFEYGMIYDKPIDRADKIAMQAAWDLCFARARWHAKSNGITVVEGPFFHVNAAPLRNDQWWLRPFDQVLTMVGWSYKGIRNEPAKLDTVTINLKKIDTPIIDPLREYYEDSDYGQS